MRNFLMTCLLALSVMLASGAGAADAALEKRVMALSEQLRCLVCQNQTIADSHAELAIDLRNQVREQLASGRSDAEVTDYMVQRYGDFVLYRPPVKGSTWLLWFGPFALLIGGVLLLGLRLSRQRPLPPPLPQEDTARAARLLDIAIDLKETP